MAWVAMRAAHTLHPVRMHACPARKTIEEKARRAIISQRNTPWFPEKEHSRYSQNEKYDLLVKMPARMDTERAWTGSDRGIEADRKAEEITRQKRSQGTRYRSMQDNLARAPSLHDLP